MIILSAAVMQDQSKELMTSYKLVTAEFKWFGLQGRVEKLVHSVCHARVLRLLLPLVLVCSWCVPFLGKWVGLHGGVEKLVHSV